MPLAPPSAYATDGAARRALRNASTVPTSGFDAPLRTATPRPVRPRSTREPATSLSRRTSSSAMSGGRMATSNESPASIRRLRSAAKATSITSRWPVMRSKTGVISRKTPLGAALLKTRVWMASAATPGRIVRAATTAAIARAGCGGNLRPHRELPSCAPVWDAPRQARTQTSGQDCRPDAIPEDNAQRRGAPLIRDARSMRETPSSLGHRFTGRELVPRFCVSR